MRGEKSWRESAKSRRKGSPPHARGKVGAVEDVSGGMGITPACAGKSTQQIEIADYSKDHPRMRGEKREKMSCPWSALGITPACAGKSFRKAIPCLAVQDHPRMRGEKTLFFSVRFRIIGSPPHARGKVDDLYEQALEARITPACAGKSFCGMPASRVDEDHPRMRGEKYTLLLPYFSQRGSPPHARGKASWLFDECF